MVKSMVKPGPFRHSRQRIADLPAVGTGEGRVGGRSCYCAHHARADTMAKPQVISVAVRWRQGIPATWRGRPCRAYVHPNGKED